MSRRHSRRSVSRIAEMQIQRELAREQVEALPTDQGRSVMIEPDAIPRAVKRAFEAIEAESAKSNRKETR